jgi:EAL domain-containing protein (putative c-di-GMP-specific phosphodiesterase class I)
MWSERVRNATEKGLFVLVSQPISEVASGRITQHEVLLRMRGEDGDLVPPGVFLATAERFGLIGGVDRWVTQQAMRLIASHRDDGNELHLEVNLSGHTMGDENFAAQVERELKATKIDPALLTFEITETAAVADVDRARQMALDLKALGCKFALDDFGAGFASFYYVKHLPIDYLKIDGEFIKDLPKNPADQLVVKALVDVCRGLEIKTIAEFVQDAETVSLLRELGVDYAQGYFIGRPAPVAHLREGGEPSSSSNGDSPEEDLLESSPDMDLAVKELPRPEPKQKPKPKPKPEPEAEPDAAAIREWSLAVPEPTEKG